jgi:tripartite-type tricarboxylate transporter receptor subunit TctC
MMALGGGASHAQSFPVKPVRLVTQFGAGSPGDVISRVLASQLREFLGQPVVVDNRVGGGGVLAAGVAAAAAPEGYTVVLLNTTVRVTAVAMGKKYSFDPAGSFTPITTVNDTVSVLLAHPALGAGTLTEVLSLSRSRAGGLSFGTPGVGSTHHLAGEEIRMISGARLVHVPYKTTPLVDVAGGVIPLAFSVVARGLPMVKSGKLRAVAVLGEARSPLLPDVPTVQEVLPGFEPPPAWTGLFAPAGVSSAVLRRLHGDAVKAVNSPEGRERLVAAEFEPRTSASPEAFAAEIKRDVALVGKIAKAAGIEPVD